MNAHQTAATETAALLVGSFPATGPHVLADLAADVVTANARAFQVTGADVLDRMADSTAERISDALPSEVVALDEFDYAALVDDLVDACAVWLIAADALAGSGITPESVRAEIREGLTAA